MQKFLPNLGFSMVELLVVVVIMGILGTITFSSFSSFGEDQKTKAGTAGVQSLLKTAQANASSGISCPPGSANFGANWWVEFQTDRQNALLKCQVGSGTIQTVTTYLLTQTVQIDSIIGGSSCNSSIISGSATSVVKAIFNSVTATITFQDGGGVVCIPNSQYLTVSFKNTRIGDTRLVKIDKGGSISAQ